MVKLISFEKFVEKNLKKKKPKIAFGLNEPNREVLKSLNKAKKYADIILVGPREIARIRKFKKIISEEPEKKLAEILISRKVEGIVRGTIDAFKTFESYEGLLGESKTKEMAELALLEDAEGRRFFLSDSSNPAGWTKAEKIKSCRKITKFIKKELGMKPKIGFITGVRHETYKRRRQMKKWPLNYLNQTYRDAESLVKYFAKKGIPAKNYAIELNEAVADGCNIIVPPNGMAGNQIFRALCLIGGGKVLCGPRVGLPHFYEDNSRNEKDFSYHLKWLVAWINSKK